MTFFKPGWLRLALALLLLGLVTTFEGAGQPVREVPDPSAIPLALTPAEMPGFTLASGPHRVKLESGYYFALQQLWGREDPPASITAIFAVLDSRRNAAFVLWDLRSQISIGGSWRRENAALADVYYGDPEVGFSLFAQGTGVVLISVGMENKSEAQQHQRALVNLTLEKMNRLGMRRQAAPLKFWATVSEKHVRLRPGTPARISLTTNEREMLPVTYYYDISRQGTVAWDQPSHILSGSVSGGSPDGSAEILWYGRDGEGETVADGSYQVIIGESDFMGRSAPESAVVQVVVNQ